jgi:DNA-binding response OmpR family regulator
MKEEIKILLVDDNEKFLKSMAERAKMKGFTVFTALDGKQAIEAAENQHVHVAVVDQKLPDTDGLVVITKLKSIRPDIHTVCSPVTAATNSRRRPRRSTRPISTRARWANSGPSCQSCRWAM